MPDNLSITLPAGAGAMAIYAPSGVPIVKIHFDGRVEVNPAFTVEEAARAFWDAVKRMSPHSDLATPLNAQAGQHKLGAFYCTVCNGNGWIGYPGWDEATHKLREFKVACPNGCPLADPNEEGVLASFPRGRGRQ